MLHTPPAATRRAATVGHVLLILSATLTKVARVITGELKSKIDRVWVAFWSGGISNPLEVIEQITCLLFIRRLDGLQILAEEKARVTGGVIAAPMFLPGHRHLRWSLLKNASSEVMNYTDHAPTGPDFFFNDPDVDVIVDTLQHIKRIAFLEEVA